ncbi:AraC family transcriptional regulator [Caldimonas brevitalea]|uniref:Cupin n=1 Tax=Caldimonas brevitalea TaxID=413882 RepID=A0A0G3BJ61_9BURK|nr:AraC family transcriptional regulator [Caldimonas brevitalea]AKJ27401.1 cupin [Caldimonas brevitalea]
MTGPHPTTLDALGEALHFLRMNGVFYCRSEFGAPFGLALPPLHDCMMFHVVTAGRCWLEVDGADPLALNTGDFVLLPRGEGHRLVSEPGADAPGLFDLPREVVSERYEVLRHGGDGPATALICGAVRFEHPAAHHLVAALPACIHIDASALPHLDWLHSSLRWMAAEAQTLRPGGETVITRLADIIVIQALREWIEQAPEARAGWLGALQDKQIGRALALMHRDPARAWTLATLASEAAMSRSAFAARFTQQVGMPAMQYLLRWRVHLALARLQARQEGLAEVAAGVGYQSEAAFSRAFKRVLGLSPGAVERPAAAR